MIGGGDKPVTSSWFITVSSFGERLHSPLLVEAFAFGLATGRLGLASFRS